MLRAEVFLADIADFDGMNKAWDEWVVKCATPARATFEAKLAATGDVVGRVTVMLRANEITYVRLRAGY